MSRREALRALLALLLLLAFTSVESSGQLQIRLVTFKNPESLADGGRCCQPSDSPGGATCGGPCRTFFRVCASTAGGEAAQHLRSPAAPPSVRAGRSPRRRAPRSAGARPEEHFTDTEVPAALPPVGEEDELLPVSESAALLEGPGEPAPLDGPAEAEEKPPTADGAGDSGGGTAIQVIHHLIPSSEDNSDEESELPTPRRKPPDPQDIGIVFVEDDDFVRLYFEPRMLAGGRSASSPPEGGRQLSRVRLRRTAAGRRPDGNTGGPAAPDSQDATGEADPEHVEDRAEGSGGPSADQELRQPQDASLQSSEAEERASPAEASPRGAQWLPEIRSCSLGVLVTGIVANSSMELPRDAAVDLSFPFGTQWPGAVTLTLEAWHDVTGSLEPSSPDLNILEGGDAVRLVGRAVVRRPLLAGGWSRVRVGAGPGRLEYLTRLVCDPGSSGSRCASSCDRAASRRGHFVCGEDGSALCDPGWRGEACDMAVCRPGCHPLTGYCRVPGECICKIGYGGELCSKCIPLPGCRHGYCKRSFECRCLEGWTGLFCNKPICADGCDKDRGFCMKPNECRCRVGWTGKHCDKCQPLPGCTRGYCQKPLECRCRPGWSGFFCERPICERGCSKLHGFCERPAVCRCQLGWRGRLCDTCLPYPGCLHGNCSQPWECNCQPGWTGFLCDKPADPCTHWQGICKNGGTCENVTKDEEPSHRCICPVGFSGASCEIAGDSSSNSSVRDSGKGSYVSSIGVGAGSAVGGRVSRGRGRFRGPLWLGRTLSGPLRRALAASSRWGMPGAQRRPSWSQTQAYASRGAP